MVIMFKSIRRLQFLKGLTNDGTIFSPGNSNWIQSFRRCSGLLEKKNDVEEVSDDLTFTAFLHQRREEARRSIIIKVSNQEIWKDLLQICNDSGYANNIIQYKEQNVPYVLIEMASEQKLHDFLRKTFEFRSDFELKNPFLQTREHFRADYKTSEEMNINLNSQDFTSETNKKFQLIKKEGSNALYKIYKDLSLNDLGVRLRFLMCRQIETFCSGFLPNPIAYPFGSSVTGFGVNGCDLDIALVPLPVDNSYLQQENFLNFHRLTVQEHITVLAELMKIFLVGCSGLTLIRNAKVPIVKYKNSFTNVECDLSIYNLHGVVMSQLLYTLSSIDYRVRPLVMGLKMWAYNTGLVNKTPGRTISNFALSLLVIFFLQHTNLLPPWNQFPQNDGFLIEEESLKMLVKKYREMAKKDSRSLEELYQSFFKFYASIDFTRLGICLRTGKLIKNHRRYPLFIENPLLKGLNVSGNVDNDEIQRLSVTFSSMIVKIKKSHSLFNLACNFEENRLLLEKGRILQEE